MNLFKCTKCGEVLDGFLPFNCACGCEIPVINGVYQFTGDAPISVDGDGLKWLGYEHVGANYEPGYFYGEDREVGIGNSDILADYLGRGKIVLDVGAGLGGSSISFARAGLYAIAADISQTMLEIAARRAQAHGTPGDKIVFTRMNGYKLELIDHSVDAVWATDVLHQVDKPELMMDEILRVLKPDGYFLQHGGSKSLGFSEEQQAANDLYNGAHKDIEDFYNDLIEKAGWFEPPFRDWDRADRCVRDHFVECMRIEGTGVYSENNRKWPLKMGLHKMKTRASGSKSLMPDAIHFDAWANTDAYARSKYGDHYEDITKYLNFEGSVVLLKRKP